MKINHTIEKFEEINDDYIKQICFNNNGNIKSSIYRHIDSDAEFKVIKQYLENRYIDIPKDRFSYKEVLYRVSHNISNRPVCKICGGPVLFIGKTINGKFPDGYHLTCCKGHERILAKQTETMTLQKKYGVKYTFQISEIKAKAQVNSRTAAAKEKKTRTMILRYGYPHNFQNHDCRTRAKMSAAEYRKNHPGYTAKSLKLRAANYAAMLQILRNNPNTSIDDYRNTQEYNEYVNAYDKTINSVNLCFSTQQTHNSLNSSKPEKELYSILSDVYDVKTNYKDHLYPFKCDYYIPTLNLYIEYQGSMFHNKHPFTNTEEDINELQNIKLKNDLLKTRTGNRITRYDNLIETWTKRDVDKRNTAKQNKLNYLEIYPSYKINDILFFIKEHYTNADNVQLIIGTNKT